MRVLKASTVLFIIGGLLLLFSPLVLGRGGQILFAVAGVVFLLAGLYARTREPRR
jgi:hypothetical protein